MASNRESFNGLSFDANQFSNRRPLWSLEQLKSEEIREVSLRGRLDVIVDDLEVNGVVLFALQKELFEELNQIDFAQMRHIFRLDQVIFQQFHLIELLEVEALVLLYHRIQLQKGAEIAVLLLDVVFEQSKVFLRFPLLDTLKGLIDSQEIKEADQVVDDLVEEPLSLGDEGKDLNQRNGVDVLIGLLLESCPVG